MRGNPIITMPKNSRITISLVPGNAANIYAYLLHDSGGKVRAKKTPLRDVLSTIILSTFIILNVFMDISHLFWFIVSNHPDSTLISQ